MIKRIMSHEQEPDGLEQPREFEIDVSEWIVDESLPEFETAGVKSYKIRMKFGELTAHQHNTEIVQFDGEFTFMDHIVVHRGRDGGEPIYFFQDPDAGPEDVTAYDKLMDTFSNNDFAIVSPPAYPSSLVMEKYYTFVRGSEELDTVLGRIIDEAV
jgi:hypothetical protein